MIMTRPTAGYGSTSTATASMRRLRPSATRTGSPVPPTSTAEAARRPQPDREDLRAWRHRDSRLPDSCTEVGTTDVEQADRRRYVSDYYVSTPSKTTYSPPLPRCTLPGDHSGDLNKRTGPGSSYAISGTLSSGALGWVACQRSDPRSARRRSGTSWTTAATFPTSIWRRPARRRTATDFLVADLRTGLRLVPATLRPLRISHSIVASAADRAESE